MSSVRILFTACSFALWSLYFLERALLGEKRSAWWGVGICAGLGLLSKYTIALLNLISGVYPLDGGDILLNGESVSKLPPHERAERGIART
ncbi:glycosyltransferase family 39 protein, partial [Acetomicrobium sp. S15 = DSM 107314]|uniref:glycosyltransferase family 39 protein n=1 Tax=Acetomicrobium sp. S15 = DSM 107314 TaxID=2529858 RepID=UPI0018E0C9C7